MWDDPNLLNRLGIATALDVSSLMECLKSLPKLVAESGYKLIILDSIAAPIRCLEDNNDRMRVTLEITSLLSKLASQMQVAVVCTNHLTTPFNSDDQELIPALGLSVSSQFDVHVELSKEQNQGEVLVKVKKGGKADGATAMFRIGEDGVRDVKRRPAQQPRVGP